MNIKIKEIFQTDYISRQAGEKLRFMILKAIQEKKKIVLDFKDLIVASTSFFDEGIAKLVDEKVSVDEFGNFIEIINLNKNDKKVLDKVTDYRGFNLSFKQAHPWRLCPIGEHWVKEHPRSSSRGVSTVVDGHCRKNPKGKDVITAEELVEIANKHFQQIKKLPSTKSLKFEDGNKYDAVIGGWCEYWNNILKPKIDLDPDLIKALIASESGFQAVPKGPKGHKAIGIMQLMPETVKYLGRNGRELKDHFVELDTKDAENPTINIAAGVRWLFRKYELLEYKLKRTPTWEEVLYDYKGFTGSKTELAKKSKLILDGFLKELKQ